MHSEFMIFTVLYNKYLLVCISQLFKGISTQWMFWVKTKVNFICLNYKHSICYSILRLSSPKIECGLE